MNTTPQQLVKLIPILASSGQPMLITGRPGIGKSDIVEQSANGINLITMYPALSDPTDFKGYPAIVNGEAVFITFGELKKLLTANATTWVFFDEIGQAAPSVQAALMSLVLARTIGGEKISPYVYFIAATNRKSDRSGVTGFLEALKSRFSIYNLEPTAADWIAWAIQKQEVPVAFIGAVKNNPNIIEKWEPSREIENVPTPRGLYKGAVAVNGAPETMRALILSGFIGDAAAIEISGYMSLVDKLPTISQIERNPHGIDVPNRPDIRYMAAMSIKRHLSPDNADNLSAYVERLGAEYTPVLWNDCGDELKGTAAYAKYIISLGNIVLS